MPSASSTGCSLFSSREWHASRTRRHAIAHWDASGARVPSERPGGRPTPAMTLPASAARTTSCTCTGHRMTVPHRHPSRCPARKPAEASALSRQLDRPAIRQAPVRLLVSRGTDGRRAARSVVGLLKHPSHTRSPTSHGAFSLGPSQPLPRPGVVSRDGVLVGLRTWNRHPLPRCESFIHRCCPHVHSSELTPARSVLPHPQFDPHVWIQVSSLCSRGLA